MLPIRKSSNDLAKNKWVFYYCHDKWVSSHNDLSLWFIRNYEFYPLSFEII